MASAHFLTYFSHSIQKSCGHFKQAGRCQRLLELLVGVVSSLAGLTLSFLTSSSS